MSEAKTKQRINWRRKYFILSDALDQFMNNDVLNRGNECPFCDVDMVDEEWEAHAPDCAIKILGDKEQEADRA